MQVQSTPKRVLANSINWQEELILYAPLLLCTRFPTLSAIPQTEPEFIWT